MSSIRVQRYPAFIGPNGEPTLDFLSKFQASMQARRLTDSEVWITVSRRRRSSDEARGYYWSVVVPIFADYMGEPTDQAAHDALAYLFLRLPNNKVTGAPRWKSTSPDSMPADEFRDYLDRVLAYGRVDCELRIPEPEKDPAKREPRRRRQAA